MITYLYGALFFILGLFCGVTVNILAYRIPRKQLFDKRKPFCPCCMTPYSPYMFIPVIGFFLYKGRCPHCKEKLSRRNPVVELLCAVAFLCVYVVFGAVWYVIPALIFIYVLMLIACIDLDIMEIPNGLVLIILVLGVIMFIMSFFGYGNLKWYDYLIGAAAISVPFFIIALITGGVGGGDIKLLFAAGLFLGWRFTVIGTVMGALIASLWSVVMLVRNGKGAKSRLPLGPALAIGLIITLLCGDYLLEAIAKIQL